MEYGLVGEKLGHSFSKIIHGRLSPKGYDLLPMNEREFDEFFVRRAFKGLNVTIPYKEKAMGYCAYIHPLAREIGAVNTVVNNGGILEGYNTDFEGLRFSIENSGIKLKGKTLIILGSGGASKTASAVGRSMGAGRVAVVSRRPENGEISYDEAEKIKDPCILINATPVGMFPNNGASPFDLSRLPNICGLFDLIYNPLKTKLILQAEAMGVPCRNGLEMLVRQAAAARAYFDGFAPDEGLVEDICAEIYRGMRNIVLIGMPASGKSVFGKKYAAETNRQFYDLDEEIAKAAGMPVEEIFSLHGEDYFRELEARCCADISKNTGCVISTGGGIVKNSLNIEALRQNGLLVFLDREPGRLVPGAGRPLSKSTADMERLYKERISLYREYGQITVDNNSSFNEGYMLLVKNIEEYAHS